MGHHRLNTPFFPTWLSLEGVIAYWQQLSQDPNTPLGQQARVILDRVEATPAIRGRIQDESVLEEHSDLVASLMSALFPIADAEAIGGAGEPFGTTNIFETPAGTSSGVLRPEAFLDNTLLTTEEMLAGEMIAAYQEVLKKAYGIDAQFDYPLLISLVRENGLRNHYQMWWDSRFIEVRPRGSLPQPTEEEFRRLLAEPTNIPLWTELLPLDRFELGGLGVVRATDVTMREAISRLKDDLLEQDAMATAANVDRWQVRIRTMLGDPDVQVGLIGFDSPDSFEAIDIAFPVGRSLLLSEGEAPACPMRGNSNYAEAFKNGQPVVVSDLDHAAVVTGFEHHLMKSGFKSLLVQPLFIGEELIGLLEVASPKTGALTAFSSFKLAEVAQPFATALERSTSEREDRIQSIIKQEYTAIHPSVEWRFREAASDLLRGDDDAAPQEIVFREVYPLYALTDIRGSSDTRSRAIQADLIEQLQLALAIVRTAGTRPAFPIFGQIGYRLERFLARIEESLHSDDETAAISFLSAELEPLLDQLSTWGPDVAAAAEAYTNALDPELGVLYRRRRAFDTSVAKFNETVSGVLDRAEVEAQAVFPHFAEKFQTDGVDYNLYIGESLIRGGGFSKLYLHNLRLWQLKVVSQIEWELSRVRPTLGVDLAPTHLVLVQDQPLSIRFRIDEKRFDVDGAYNIRYELVKKRIDKARIRETGERLTQPGYLAVVYSQVHEGVEYRRYLEYLTSAGYYVGEVEDHELEDMQGVLGLRALRVAINPDISEQIRETSAAVRPEELAQIGQI